MSTSPAAIFAKIIRKDPEAVARVLAENVEALVGGKVSMELVPRNSDQFATLFGDRELYVFPIEDHSGTPFPSLLAFDVPAAIHSGGAFSLMGPEQIKEILRGAEVPEILHDSIGEVANIICGAAVHMIRTRVAEAPQFRRGAGFGRKHVGTWPSLLAEFGPRVPWEIVACKLSMNGEDRGAIFFSASDGEQGKVTREEIIAVAGPGPEPEPEPPAEDDDIPLIPDDEPVEAPAPPAPAPRPAAPPPVAEPSWGEPDGLDDDDQPAHDQRERVRAMVTSLPADPAAAGLRSTLEAVGALVMPAFAASSEQVAPPDAMFIVSRSRVDLGIRLERFPPGRRPGLVIACSDRPTPELVRAARGAGADDFLVLPASVERLRALLQKVPAAVG